MQAPPASAQKSDTPFKDVVDLGTAIARAKGLDAANAEAAGRISLGLFFAETNGNQTIGNARSNKYKGSLQTGTSEDLNGRRKWAAIKPSIAAFDPALIQRDDKEEARAGNLDHRYNHWTSVRDALMNAHAEVFPQVPAIVKTLPDPIDQMKLFELIQIIPAPTKSALKSGNLLNYRVSDPTIMGFLRNNSIFTFGQADRAQDICNHAAKSSMRCGCSMPNSNRRLPGSRRSRRGKRFEAGRWNLATGNSWFILPADAVRCGHEARIEVTLGESGDCRRQEKIRPVRLWRLAPPPHHRRRDGRLAAAADRGQPCRLAVGCLQGLVKAGQSPNVRRQASIAKARRRAKAGRFQSLPG